MCPDHQILSVYFDKELGSPWKEKLEAHLAGCPQCRSQLELYAQTRSAIAVSGTEEARERIWQKLEPLANNAYGRTYADRNYGPRVRSVWSRSLSVPFPVVAAAGLIMVLALTLLVVLRPKAPVSTMPQLADMSMELQATPITDMGSLIEYLNSDNSPDMVIIKLPETTFTSTGQPRIIRAADYSRINPSK